MTFLRIIRMCMVMELLFVTWRFWGAFPVVMRLKTFLVDFMGTAKQEIVRLRKTKDSIAPCRILFFSKSPRK